MKDFNALLWQRVEEQSCEMGHIENDLLHSADIKNRAFDEFYMKYVQPNAAVFKENYTKNRHLLNSTEYEKCTLDFVPIADKQYVIVDRCNRCFCGTFIAKPYVEGGNVEDSIFSVLIADEWDIRKIMPVILEKRWNHVYFVLNGETEKFASFFKLEEFPATLPPNIKFFATTEEMRQFFLDDPDAYLPKRIIAPEPGEYEALFKEIHDTRIRSGIPSNNVFLSICMPSYNRGSLALENVMHTLKNQFDAEIEVVVANNGSTIGIESYQKIRDLRDSRVRYYEFENNEGLSNSWYNILGKAHGHYAFVHSDEDPMIVENIGEVLECLVKNRDIGVFTFCAGNSELTMHKRENVGRFKKGLEAIKWATKDILYFSGSCFNLDFIKEEGTINQAKGYEGRQSFKDYVQCILGLLLGANHDSLNGGIVAWNAGKVAEEGGNLSLDRRDDGVTTGSLPEERVSHLEGFMDIAVDVLSGDDLDEFFWYLLNRKFRSCAYACKLFGTKYEAVIGSWLNIWKMFYQASHKIMKKHGLQLSTALKKNLDDIFSFDLIYCKRLQNLHTPEENLLPSLQAQIVKYYYEKGIPSEDIDLDQIEKALEGWVQNFLAKGM